MNTRPEKWCLVPVSDDLVKVFGTWSGSYLIGSSWRINSGIEEVEETDDAYLFTGCSGSVYECRKDMYGSNAYGYAILELSGLNAMTEEEAKEWIDNAKDANH